MTRLPKHLPTVLDTFGLVGSPVPLPGGQGTSWRVGDVVLKPHVDPVLQAWLGTEVAGIDQRDFRMPSVRRALNGEWVVAGWGAQSMLPGLAVQGPRSDWRSVIRASRAFHTATAALGRPAFLDRRRDAWAWADAAAWGERPDDVQPQLRDLVQRLRSVPLPLGPAQLVHGDLTGNVLLSPGEPPSVIDVSPYWRPPSYAEGIIVADALCWHEAPIRTVEDVDVPVEAVARGLLFRLLTSSRLHENDTKHLQEEAERYDSVATALGL